MPIIISLFKSRPRPPLQKTLCRWSPKAGGDMWQEATPGTCVPCLPGEIEPWAECLWVWRNYRLGGRLTCLWHQRRQPRRRWRKPAVVIVHKLRRHVFEEFMRWLYCTHRGISPSWCLVSRAHHHRHHHHHPQREESAPVCAPLSTTEFGLLLSLPPYTKSCICHRGPIMFAEVVFTSPVIARAAPIPPSFPSPSTMNQRRRLVGLRYLFLVTLSLAKLLCFLGGGLVSFSFPFNRRFEVSEWWMTLEWLEMRSVGSGMACRIGD